MIPLKDHYTNTIVIKELKDSLGLASSYGCSEGYQSYPQYGALVRL